MGGDLAVIADARDGLGHRLGCFVDGEDFGALAGEQHRGGAAIAPARTDTTSPGNERDFAFLGPQLVLPRALPSLRERGC